jgi:hypothetical protein
VEVQESTDLDAAANPTGTPCDQATRLLPAASRGPPRLQLLPGADTLLIPYGSPAPFSLAPCTNGSRNSSCGAVAWQRGADGNNTDFSASIKVEDATPCEKGQVGLVWRMVWHGVMCGMCSQA